MHDRRVMTAHGALSFVLAAACASDVTRSTPHPDSGPQSDAGIDAGVPALQCFGGIPVGQDGGAIATAPHLAFPQMPNHGVAPFSRLQLVTVTFAGYPYRATVESFGDFVVHSQWLAAITQDYGPIAASHIAKLVLPAPAEGAQTNFAALV